MYANPMVIRLNTKVVLVSACLFEALVCSAQESRSIFAAAAQGDLNASIAFIASGANVNSRSPQGMTPLMLAAGGRHLPVVRTLISRGADVNAKVVGPGYTPLMIASAMCDVSVVKVLLDSGASINDRDNEPSLIRTALYYARGCPAGVSEYLIERGGGRELIGQTRAQILEDFVRGTLLNNSYPSIERLLAMSGVVRVVPDSEIDSALVSAVLSENSSLVRHLLSRGANPHATTERIRIVPLVQAALAGNIDIVKLLLEAKADVNMGPAFALEAAAGRGHVQVLKLLLEAKADVNMGPYTALMAAVDGGHLGIAKMLLDNGANPNLGTKKVRTALKRAEKSRHPRKAEMIKILREAGATK